MHPLNAVASNVGRPSAPSFEAHRSVPHRIAFASSPVGRLLRARRAVVMALRHGRHRSGFEDDGVALGDQPLCG